MMEQENTTPIERMFTLSEVKDLLRIGYGRIFELIDLGRLEAFSLCITGTHERIGGIRLPAPSKAGITGCSQDTIRRAEQGHKVRPATVIKLARALGCDPDDLLRA
jgi:helix-turn-helix protein